MGAVSEKQLKANRENAKQGGVKTAEGKAISKCNALKHGVLSDAIIIEHDEYTEDRSLFEQIREQLFEDLHPVGIVEMMLVERLLTTYWRLQRVGRAERAAVERSMTECHMKQSIEQSERAVFYRASMPEEQRRHPRTSLVYAAIEKKMFVLSETMKNVGLPFPSFIQKTLEENLGLDLCLPNLDLLLMTNYLAERAKHDGEEEKVQVLEVQRQPSYSGSL